MIHIPFLFPLFAGGLLGAVWRDFRPVATPSKPLLHALILPGVITEEDATQQVTASPKKLFDDMDELRHYQRVSWYALALSSSGVWFYPPALLLSIPLLSYNTYNFARTLSQTEASARHSPMTAFEVIGVVGTLVTVRPLMASLMFLFVFGIRNLFLHTNNLAHIDFAHVMNSSFAKVWRLHDGVEIEVAINELQPGDTVVIHSGDLVLVEGEVIEGVGIMEQYSLQKKLKAVPKQLGDRVFPFTQLQSGCLHIEKA